MKRKAFLLGLAVALIAVAVVGTALAAQPNNTRSILGKPAKKTCDFTKHVHEMGGPQHECLDCHNGEKADVPGPLTGKYAHMGGPNHSCADCHNGQKAPELPLPPDYGSCGDCHESQPGNGNRG